MPKHSEAKRRRKEQLLKASKIRYQRNNIRSPKPSTSNEIGESADIALSTANEGEYFGNIEREVNVIDVTGKVNNILEVREELLGNTRKEREIRKKKLFLREQNLVYRCCLIFILLFLKTLKFLIKALIAFLFIDRF